jgi:hypothetical protein
MEGVERSIVKHPRLALRTSLPPHPLLPLRLNGEQALLQASRGVHLKTRATALLREDWLLRYRKFDSQ